MLCHLTSSSRREYQEELGKEITEIRSAAFPVPLGHHYYQAQRTYNTALHPPREVNDRLLFACKVGRLRDVEYLMKKGAEAKFLKRTEGVWGALEQESPIHHVLLRLAHRGEGRSSDPAPPSEAIQMLRLLVESGADVNSIFISKCWTGSSTVVAPLHIACSLSADDIGESNLKDVFALLLDKKYNANVNLTCEEGVHTMRYDGARSNTPLSVAVEANSLVAVRSLLEAGANPNLKNAHSGQGCYKAKHSTQCPALVTACRYLSRALDNDHSTLQIIELLLKHGADPNAWCLTKGLNYMKQKTARVPPSAATYKETAIHIAAEKHSIPALKLLLEAGADPTLCCSRPDWSEERNIFELLEGNKIIREQVKELIESLPNRKK